MYVAWRDLRRARGRFALIGAVVALITLLVGFLAGLTGGLAGQNVSAVLGLPGDRLVLAAPDGEDPSFTTSTIPPATVDAWSGAAGVSGVVPVGIVQGRAAGPDGGTATGVALVGLPRGAPSSAVADLAPATDGEVGLSAGAAQALHARPGDPVSVGGTTYRVATVGADASYSHTPVVALTPTAWAATDRQLGGDGEATVLAVSGDPDWDAVAAATGTSAASPLLSLTALPTFRSEVGSLALMIGLLFGISALVVGAFFTVWTMQRAGDVAVLKALGASTASLARDALGQALVVLVAGIGVGTAVVVAAGAALPASVPFLVDPLTTAAPAAALTLLGLAGAAVALRTVVSTDPLTALGSAR
ncbi:FtsX-like permease family protein [Klenkia sp. PcliD-1-E]|uniref:FtsX-like permease family protein n=1 Tax=Klenkia sp. PcliD-1-E TaxID=2954492 RepID=UPI002097A8CB|nr:ABC transporter permease [Klenkia sp. PcliD-1-E]MCO7221322.1 ABC transporter permease [Klenkia sp. PcliD-1-E]